MKQHIKEIFENNNTQAIEQTRNALNHNIAYYTKHIQERVFDIHEDLIIMSLEKTKDAKKLFDKLDLKLREGKGKITFEEFTKAMSFEEDLETSRTLFNYKLKEGKK